MLWSIGTSRAPKLGLRVAMVLCLTFAGVSLGATDSSTESPAWFPFAPELDRFQESALDLRHLNEKFAGEHGFIAVKGGEFVYGETGAPVRFWGVNGPPHQLKGEELRRCARLLTKRGVNLVRVHGGLFDESGEVDPAKVKHVLEVVEAMKREGIYSHLSIYFPLWLRPKPETEWLKGYDGKSHPFAALFFNPDFQAQYRKWWTALLTARLPESGKTLVEEPAVAGLEIQNEDSLFFWTFDEKNIPDAQLKIFERLFAEWLAKKYGSLPAAFDKWKQLKVKRDAPTENRVGFRPLWNIFNEKTPRDQDTAQFLFEIQTGFYRDTYAFLKKLGFKGVITASNWATASPEVFGPLEKLSYVTAGDFVDRHGYFSCNHEGDNAAWSLRNGHTYSDRSALRFDGERPGKPKQFVHPAMDPHYGDRPSMLSETTWNRPNRFRSEAPLYFAAYGALQHSDAIVHFALDGADWSVKPGFWMQPWTLMSPSMMGQFPAAALIYRRGLLQPGSVLAEIGLNGGSLLHLEGTPLPQDAAFDELRLKDVPVGTESKPGQRLDPLMHYAGRVNVNFYRGGDSRAGSVRLSDAVTNLINHSAKTVKSSTGELVLDYGNGVLLIDAPQAQGISGAIQGVGKKETRDLVLFSDLDLGHVVVVALDGRPLSTSTRMLLQVMSEEKTSGFETEEAGAGIQRIRNIGTDPWLVKSIQGTVAFKRADARQLQVQALDFNGYPAENCGTAQEIKLKPKTLYYLITKSAQ